MRRYLSLSAALLTLLALDRSGAATQPRKGTPSSDRRAAAVKGVKRAASGRAARGSLPRRPSDPSGDERLPDHRGRFDFPDRARVRAYPAGAFLERPARPGRRPGRSELPIPQEDFEEIRRAIRKGRADPSAVERVLVPFVGGDAALAFLVFPGAREVVGFDASPFLHGRPRARYTFASRPTVNFSFEGSLGGHEGDEVGMVALGKLSALPSFELVSVSTASTRGPDGRSERHGVIEFRLADGVLRRYVHLQLSIEESPWGSTQDRWAWQEVQAFAPQAVIAKGTMNRLRPGADLDGHRRDLLDGLEREGGILVEGTTYRDWMEQRTKVPELSDGDRGARVLTSSFGYEGPSHVTVMKRRRRPVRAAP